jgi:hypothetical protein
MTTCNMQFLGPRYYHARVLQPLRRSTHWRLNFPWNWTRVILHSPVLAGKPRRPGKQVAQRHPTTMASPFLVHIYSLA